MNGEKIIKRYVSVDLHVDEVGNISPTIIYWHDGRKFSVDRILDIRPAASRRAGGKGIRYLCRILGVETVVYFEDPKWFVEEKIKGPTLH